MQNWTADMIKDIDTLVRKFYWSGPVILLESQSPDHPAGQVSYLAAAPSASIEALGDEILVKKGDSTEKFNKNPWNALHEFYKEQSDWLFGYLGYDLKNSIEDLHSQNPDPVQAPDLYFMEPTVLIKIDHRKESIRWIKGNSDDEFPEKPDKRDEIKVTDPEYTVSRQEYLSAIEEAKRRISEGDFYEINLSHQMKAGYEGSPFKLYRSMRSVGPVPFGAFILKEDIAVCSMSPERFLAKKGDRVFSQPIKGTTRRGSDESDDRKLRDFLKDSQKNRAENLMIVDLVRNDLSKISAKGSVKVSDLFEIQTFGTVHQMVSTVEAQSVTDNPIEIIKACYPMGSMTGAPKISAMKSIEELENYRRGIYSGAIGYIEPYGDFDFSVVIRTAILKENNLYYSVGGAITGDSDPEEEWEETIIKARALTKAF